MKIDRHKLKNFHLFEEDVEEFESKVHKYLASYIKRPQNLGRHYKRAIRITTSSILLQKPKDQIVRYLELSLNLGLAHFISALELDEDFPIQYEGKTYSYTFKKSKAHVSVADWQRLFYLAVVLRNVDAITLLTQKIHTHYLREANVKGDEADYLYVDTLKALVTQEMDVIGDLLVQTMDATDPERLPAERHSYILEIMVPTLCTVEPFLSSDQPRFNQELGEALEAHQYFWSKEDMAFDREGWISLPLLMVSVLAYDNRQFNITVESDYIPKWLIERNWGRTEPENPPLNNAQTNNPSLLLESIGASLNDQQLKTFSVRCYRGIDEIYLAEEAKTVIQIVESELLGQVPLVSPPEALSALSLEIMDSSINDDTLRSVVSTCISTLLEKPPLVAAANAISARQRVADAKELYLKGQTTREGDMLSSFSKQEDMKQVANLLREV